MEANVNNVFLLVLIVVGLSGCATPAPAPVEERAAGTVVNPYVIPKQRTEAIPLDDDNGGEAIVSLLDLSDKQSRVGRLDAAGATLERALRIQPRNPLLWQRLARIRLEQGQLDQADGLAAKAMALAIGKQALRAKIWKLVAEIRHQQGDTEGERAALAKSDALSGASD
ncbi:MAG: tetratricopeptide repeat protein [Gammaproteobacteria bacterium]|nr:tetratricopeptide repeat protein [Gammaproteobacteria bacterium]